MQKAEEKIGRYTKDVADAVARKNAVRAQITESEQKMRKLQASLPEIDATVKAAEAKLNQYMETKERVTNRIYNIRDINAKLNGALKSRVKPSKIQFPADQFSDDERS
jgi:chromosome segregation ATPase